MSDKPRAGDILGVNARTYPRRQLLSGIATGKVEDGPTLRAVLVAGAAGDYACYVGFGPPEWVADHGDKLSFEEACCHFPGGQLEKERYRL